MTWDCIVVGGGAAGLSAGLVLGRARRRTLIIDKGEPSNRFAHGIGGLLGQDGRAPQDFYADGREELEKYPSVEHRRGEVTGGAPGFTLTLADGTTETAKSVVLATGHGLRLSGRAGRRGALGQTAFHCPFCHGWEVQDRPLFVLDPTEFGPDRAKLLSAWSDDVTLLTEHPLELRDDEIVLADGTTHPCGGLLIGVRLSQRSGLAAQLGVEAARAEPDVRGRPRDRRALRHDRARRVRGGRPRPARQPSVASAVASGSMAAAMAVHALVLAH